MRDANTLSASVVTPSRRVTEATVHRVDAPSVQGQVGILPNHSPLLAELGPGVVVLAGAGTQARYFVTGGFVEVENDRVVVLAESAEAVDSLDVAQAQAELVSAQRALATTDAYGPDAAQARRRYAVAESRVDAAARAAG